jgi:hypothetical protein
VAEDFAAAAARLAGLAGALLGWRPDEFWRSTPAELGAVVRAMRGEGVFGDSDLDQLRAMIAADLNTRSP